MKKFAGQTQVGEWLREQSAESFAALRQLLHELVAWVWQQLLHAGQRQVFLDDTQLEVSGKKFEVAALIANQIYHLIAALAYDLMVAIKLLDLSDECQAWRVKTLLKKLVMLPGRLSQRSRQWVPGVLVPGAWLSWWQRRAQRVWTEHAPGRPRLVVAAG